MDSDGLFFWMEVFADRSPPIRISAPGAKYQPKVSWLAIKQKLNKFAKSSKGHRVLALPNQTFLSIHIKMMFQAYRFFTPCDLKQNMKPVWMLDSFHLYGLVDAGSCAVYKLLDWLALLVEEPLPANSSKGSETQQILIAYLIFGCIKIEEASSLGKKHWFVTPYFIRLFLWDIYRYFKTIFILYCP